VTRQPRYELFAMVFIGMTVNTILAANVHLIANAYLYIVACFAIEMFSLWFASRVAATTLTGKKKRKV
jgi:hypothetical protein